ncbi:MAG: hypothetical protein KatS3mg057_0895 [Herpetosiphonaceae bacterium]|nr:MAG: hypothetical protein KatS3mg057_0895 [Herpetosiphonaceae bacterium]
MYIATIFVAGATLIWLSTSGAERVLPQWPTFVALTTLATLAQLFKAEAPNHKLYYATRIFQFAAVLLLHPFLFVLLQIICHVVEWAKERLIDSPHLRKWYIQPFNIAVHIIASFAARWFYLALEERSSSFPIASSVVGAIFAAATYLVINHLLVGIVLILARGIPWRNLIQIDEIVPDFINLCLGYAIAVLWLINPWLILPVLSPLVLIYQALTIPQLKHEAQTDSKTELWNARHFNQLFQAEMERAQRFHRPLALIMADLDLLRDINNTYGHLAGDAVLKGVGKIIRQSIREYDIAGRFGGEEFAIALPETEPQEALVVAERIRQAVIAEAFRAPTIREPIRATMSLGLACFPYDAQTMTSLVHAADVAVYQAKMNGRNRIVCAADLPHAAQESSFITGDYAAGEEPAAQQLPDSAIATDSDYY